MEAERYIHKVINSCRLALEKLEQGDKKLALGDLDFGHEFIIASKYLLLAEIEEEEENDTKIEESN